MICMFALFYGYSGELVLGILCKGTLYGLEMNKSIYLKTADIADVSYDWKMCQITERETQKLFC